ncbi:hypothetical protein CHCC14568_1346 [Bacillus licheniformis]|nr:hypothetical protein CHCC15315_3224 [Bacillus licheniformis]TWM54683.1 hypothetical protein CHCC14815_0684 [Bacillus licheniformis]TWM66274.1 hypothetical protein CHCC14813_2553 [Bacillus licheniformis]TWN03909.1 hypothetical protein CHCC14568_1346 [Bacillus licheniformis]TWN56582.1 hypothetical protein CHCC14437_2254 [Bacillus licheniformis]
MDRIERVVDTFSPRRNSVKRSSKEGKIENCSGSCMFIVVRSTINAREILTIIKMLNIHVGKGMISIATMRTTPDKIDKSLADMLFLSF